MVRVEVAVPEPGVMLLGEKVQLSVLGRPLHERVIGVFDVPDCIAAVTVTLLALPSGTVTAFGDALKVMTGAVGAGGVGGAGCVGGVGLTGVVFGQLGA
jgi:hypothetical protein